MATPARCMSIRGEKAGVSFSAGHADALPGHGRLQPALQELPELEISQRNPEEVEALELPPERLVALARQYQCPSISYTYTDPVVYYEYTLDTCTQARAAGLKTSWSPPATLTARRPGSFSG